MIYEDTPFLSAQSAIEDAISYMTFLLLPMAHEEREGLSDADCVEQAVAFLDSAERVLYASGVEQKEVGGEEVDGAWVPELAPEIHDQQAFEASEKIRSLNIPLRKWQSTGVTMVMTKDFVERVRNVLEPFARRLHAEWDYADRQSDLADAQSF